MHSSRSILARNDVSFAYRPGQSDGCSAQHTGKARHGDDMCSNSPERNGTSPWEESGVMDKRMATGS